MLFTVTFAVQPAAACGSTPLSIIDGDGTPPDDLDGVPPPIPAPPILYAVVPGAFTITCRLDVDLNRRVDVATDVVYIARRLLSLVPVPASFRSLDPGIPPDNEIAQRIDALGSLLDVDGSGVVDVATDVVYIARHLLGLPPVPSSFRNLDPSIPPDAEVTAAIDALCSGACVGR